MVYSRVCRVLDLDPDDEKWVSARREVNSAEGIEFEAIFRGWVEDRMVDEVVRIFNAAQVGCNRIMNAREMAEYPHYCARGVYVEWEYQQLGKTVKRRRYSSQVFQDARQDLAWFRPRGLRQ